MNIERKEHFDQVCVWPGCTLKDTPVEEFEQIMKEKFNVRVQFLEEIETKPDTDENNQPVPETGGRPDLFFAVHSEDIGHFAVPRLQVGIRWIEDVLASCNYHNNIYPKRVFDYCGWNEEHLAKKE